MILQNGITKEQISFSLFKRNVLNRFTSECAADIHRQYIKTLLQLITTQSNYLTSQKTIRHSKNYSTRTQTVTKGEEREACTSTTLGHQSQASVVSQQQINV